MSVTIGWIDNGNTRGEFTESVTKLAAYEGIKHRLVSIVRVQSGPMMEEGRNLLVEQFLRTGADWLFMVDTDMVFDHDAVERLLASADPLTAPMVGGLCFGVNKELGQFPTMYRTVDGLPTAMMDVEPDTGCVPVDGTGAAFVLTHRDVYLHHARQGHPHKWFHRRQIPGTMQHQGGMLGEDLSWCWHLRSEGVTILVDTSVQAGQVKPTIVDADTYGLVRQW